MYIYIDEESLAKDISQNPHEIKYSKTAHSDECITFSTPMSFPTVDPIQGFSAFSSKFVAV